MNAKRKPTKSSWTDPDDAPELTRDLARRAQIAIGGKVMREADGTLTKRGRPPVGDESKQQVTLRLAPRVIRYFKDAGGGWQTRLNETLEQYVAGSLRERSRSMTRSGAGVYAMAKRSEQTGKKAGTAASKVMRSVSTGKSSKTAAASALTQRPNKKKK